MTQTNNRRSFYQENGYLVVEDLLKPAQVDTLRHQIEAIADRKVPFPTDCLEYEPGAPPQAGLDHLRKINAPATHDQVFRDHADTPAILNVVEELLGPDIKLFGDQIFMKPPGGMEKTYHQDSPYFKIEPMALVTCWAALDDVTLDNGCLYFVPGSHRLGPLDHSQPWMVGDRQDMTIPETVFDRSAEVPITLSAGSCSFHHSLILHRSGPNNTPHRRRGMATHYMSARSQWTGLPEEKPQYPLLRGQAFPHCV